MEERLALTDWEKVAALPTPGKRQVWAQVPRHTLAGLLGAGPDDPEATGAAGELPPIPDGAGVMDWMDDDEEEDGEAEKDGEDGEA